MFFICRILSHHIFKAGAHQSWHRARGRLHLHNFFFTALEFCTWLQASFHFRTGCILHFCKHVGRLVLLSTRVITIIMCGYVKGRCTCSSDSGQSEQVPAALAGVRQALLCFALSLLLTAQRHRCPTIKRPFAIRTDSESNNSQQPTGRTKARRVRDHRGGHRAPDQHMETGGSPEIKTHPHLKIT